MSNILIIQGHPDADKNHYCHALADAYAAAARDAGHDVEIIDVGKLDIPFLCSKEEWENGAGPDFVISAQQAIKNANHLIFIYPLWMGSMPAMLKAWLEQVLRSNFAFDVKKTGWTSKLKGRTARVIITMGMPAFIYRWFFQAHGLKSFKRNILMFSGIKPVRTDLIGNVEAKNNKARLKWLDKMAEYGKDAR